VTGIDHAEANRKSEAKRLNRAWIWKLDQSDGRRCDVVQCRVPAWEGIDDVAAGGAKDGERFPAIAAGNVEISSGDEGADGVAIGSIGAQAIERVAASVRKDGSLLAAVGKEEDVVVEG
jgi:hypothetical protein